MGAEIAGVGVGWLKVSRSPACGFAFLSRTGTIELAVTTESWFLREDVFISLVFVDREDWSFGNGEPW